MSTENLKGIYTMPNGRKIELSTKTLENKELTKVLMDAYKNKTRVRLFYGDTITGRSWNEERDVMGTLSTSTGDVALLLLIHHRRCFGGPAILDSCIIRVDDTRLKKVLYRHPNFHTGLKLDGNTVKNVMDFPIANFPNEEKARSYFEFMEGNRYSTR